MERRIRLLRTEDVDAVLQVYQRAFAGFPWHENLSDEEVTVRWNKQSAMSGFTAIVAEVDSRIAGAHWYDTTSLARLAEERGRDLAGWAEKQIRRFDLNGALVWERELLVDPDFQRRGISAELRRNFLKKLERAGRKTLVLTRLRTDNIGSIKTAERFGFKRTGIIQPASQRPLFHEFWFIKINC